mgnify:CR=1 FL=1
MQDLLQMGMDEELSEVMEMVKPGDKIKVTVEVTVREVDEERFKGTVDMIHSDVETLSESDEEEEYEEEDTEEEEYEDMDEEAPQHLHNSLSKYVGELLVMEVVMKDTFLQRMKAATDTVSNIASL